MLTIYRINFTNALRTSGQASAIGLTWIANPGVDPQKVASSYNGVLHTRHAQLDARAHEAP